MKLAGWLLLATLSSLTIGCASPAGPPSSWAVIEPPYTTHELARRGLAHARWFDYEQAAEYFHRGAPLGDWWSCASFRVSRLMRNQNELFRKMAGALEKRDDDEISRLSASVELWLEGIGDWEEVVDRPPPRCLGEHLFRALALEDRDGQRGEAIRIYNALAHELRSVPKELLDEVDEERLDLVVSRLDRLRRTPLELEEKLIDLAEVETP